MNTCKTCRYWGEGFYRDDDADRICDHPKHGECVDSNHKGATDLLIYPYSEGASFITGPNFGCIHHEAKPAGE